MSESVQRSGEGLFRPIDWRRSKQQVKTSSLLNERPAITVEGRAAAGAEGGGEDGVGVALDRVGLLAEVLTGVLAS